MWQRYWNLTADPFFGPSSSSSFVRTPTHAEAFARLVASIESGQRLAVLRGAEGLGKSALLDALVKEMKGPKRRFARISGPVDGLGMFQGVARALGTRVAPEASKGTAWRALGDAIRLIRFQKLQVVVVVDDAQTLENGSDLRDLEYLARIDPHPETKLTLIVSSREEACIESLGPGSSDWLLSIRLMPLTRSEVIQYVTEKLSSSGRSDPAFSPKALNMLHDLTGGVPLGLNRLASLGLMAGAARGLEMVTPDVIEDVARECIRGDVGRLGDRFQVVY